LPSAAIATGSALEPDEDDSWHPGRPQSDQSGKQVSPLDDGLTMQWQQAAPLTVGREVSLRFEIVDGSGRSVTLEPYLGMLGHAILRRDDGTVFIHLHPAGSISVASQQVFQLRSGENPFGPITPERMEKLCRAPGGERPQQPTLSFPYEFPKPGRYRVWVQAKVDGRVRTGVFDAEVLPAK
jgi:hypothetical protein